MNIIDKVVDETRGITRRTGRRVTTVYLGEAEFNELQDIERGMEFRKDFYCKHTKKYGGYFCAGLKIVRVLETTHFQVI
tara:strand:+ start:113 stop:349 length:237 start_codon:yes stop_codon:yes gene_type:complete